MSTVGILYIATGSYSTFWKNFYLTAKQFLLSGIPKKFFCFTDTVELYGEKEDPDIVKILIAHREWPYSTLLRFELFENNRSLFEDCSFLFYFNANTVFTDVINPEEILPEKKDLYLVALSNNDLFPMHPDQFTYERNPKSQAYIPYGEGTHYYRGGLNGGRTPEFLKLIRTCNIQTKLDLQSNIVAIWHDESHLNKYLLGKPIKVLGTVYGKAEEWRTPSNAKIIFADKDRILGAKLVRKIKRRSPKYSLLRWISKLIKKLSS